MSDFNNRLLIYVEKRELKPTGGASGYNYNLHIGLENVGAQNYSYLNSPVNAKDNMHAMKDSVFKRFLFIFFRIANVYKILHKKKNYAKTDLSNFKIVHFHSSKDLYEARTSLESYDGKIVLTCHQPKPYTYEFVEDVITPFERKFFKKFYMKMLTMEKYAFNRADYIVFPCQDAEEPYYDKWADYKKIHEDNKKKYRYILTGTQQLPYKVDRDSFRRKYNIGSSDFLVSYVGRHNHTKGYDNLKQIGVDLSSENIHFIIAGKEDPLKGLDSNNWHEIGWTNDPGSLINASDVFVLPNTSTYFDLVLLEVLSFGKIVVASRTGGNKFFEKIYAPGIILYDTLEEAESKIVQIKAMTVSERKKLEQSNEKLFYEYFNTTVFAENYISLINSLE